MTKQQRPLLTLALLSLLVSVSGCANSPWAKSVQDSLAADPRLQDNPNVFGQPSPTARPTVSPTVQQLPADFPAEIPLYPKAQLQAVTQTNQAGQPLSTVKWHSADSSTQVQTFYRQALQTNNWKILSQPTERTQGSFVAQRDSLQATVTIAPGRSSAGAGITLSPSPTPSPTATPSVGTTLTIQYRLGTQAATASPSTPIAASPTPTGPDANSSGFTDLSKAPAELQQPIQDLAALDVLQLTPGQSATGTALEPNKTITRRQFARWLFSAYNRLNFDKPTQQIRPGTQDGQPAFQDVARTDPDFPAIQGLAEAGIIPSRLAGTDTAALFKPDAPLTRETLLAWKVPLDLRQSLPNATVKEVEQTWGFQDSPKIDPKALRAILADYSNGDRANIRRVFGFTTLLQPKKPVTRAEAAASLWYFGTQAEGVSAADVLRAPSQAQSPSAPETSSSSSPGSSTSTEPFAAAAGLQ